jgi:hypothetical protein
MSAERARVLSDFVAGEMAQRPKWFRNVAVVMLVLCGGGSSMLAGVLLSGSGTLDDVGPPLVLLAAFTAFSVVLLVWKLRELRSIPSHPLVLAIKEQPSLVTRVTPFSAGLVFELGTGESQWVTMGATTRAEMMSWLSNTGARVG